MSDLTAYKCTCNAGQVMSRAFLDAQKQAIVGFALCSKCGSTLDRFEVSEREMRLQGRLKARDASPGRGARR